VWIAKAMGCLFFLIGLAGSGAIISYGVLHPYEYVAPDLNCNGSTMSPGDTCVTTTYVNGVPQGTTTETYDDRIRAADRESHNSGTLIIVCGSIFAAFSLTGLVATSVTMRKSYMARQRLQLARLPRRGGAPPRRPDYTG